MRHTILAAILLSLTACDQPSDAPAGDIALRAGAPGLAWGPCGDGCEPGTECLKDGRGSICAPTCEAPGCDGPAPMDMCGSEMPTQCLAVGACVIPCTGDTDCAIGWVCGFERGACVNPGQ